MYGQLFYLDKFYFQLSWLLMVEQRRGYSENYFRSFNEAQDHKTDMEAIPHRFHIYVGKIGYEVMQKIPDDF